MNKIRNVASTDGKKETDKYGNLNTTTYSHVEERKSENRINTSNSVSNTFSAHDSYLSEKGTKNSGYQSPGLPYDASSAKIGKKGKRKPFSTTKKKMGSVNMNMNCAQDKSISPSLRLKSKNRGKPSQFQQSTSTKISRGKQIICDSPNSSFTIEDRYKSTTMDGKNLIDEFNQKYANSEKNDNLDQDNSDNSDSGSGNTNDTALNENVAVIHVIDETKKRTQDFKCSISKLLKHMKYFEKSINGCEDKVGLDISVHCDLDTFEWLIKYIHLDRQIIHKDCTVSDTDSTAAESNITSTYAQANGMKVLPMFDAISMYETSVLKPISDLTLNLSNIITLLVAAEYLKMDKLKEECVEFIGKYFEDICKLKINMNFLKPQTLERLSSFVDIDVLDVMRERKDKFISKLFDKKLEHLLMDESKKLQRCIFCDTLYTSNTQLICTQNPDYFIDAHGELRCFHIADCDFDTAKFVRFVKERYRVSWRELYWKIWSFNYTFRCSNCNEEFALPKYCFCPTKASQNIAKSSMLEQSGATPLRENFHNIEFEKNTGIYQSMMKRKHIICESYIIANSENQLKDTSDEEEKSKPFHKRINHFDGMNDEEVKFFTPTQQGELLSCNYRLSLHKALQDYLVDCRIKENRPIDEKSDFEIDTDHEAEEKEGLPHPDFFDINIKPECLYRELDYIRKRLEDRKKVQIKHAVKQNKQLTKEQENKKRELRERERQESLQGDVIEDDSAKGENHDSEPKEEQKQSQADDKPLVDSGSGDKIQDDSGKGADKSPAKKPIVILSAEEIKDKLDNHIEDIGMKIENRMKLSKKLLLRDMDTDIMGSLTKALKMKREKASPCRINKRQQKRLPPVNTNATLSSPSQNSRPKPKKLKDRPYPHSGVFASASTYLKPGSASSKRPSSVETKKRD